MEILNSHFARRLKEARKELGYTQTRLAEMLGVEPPTVSRWESGKDLPKEDRLPDLCKALKVSLDYFNPQKPINSDLRRAFEDALKSTNNNVVKIPTAWGDVSLSEIAEYLQGLSLDTRSRRLAVLLGKTEFLKETLPDHDQTALLKSQVPSKRSK